MFPSEFHQELSGIRSNMIYYIFIYYHLLHFPIYQITIYYHLLQLYYIIYFNSQFAIFITLYSIFYKW